MGEMADADYERFMSRDYDEALRARNYGLDFGALIEEEADMLSADEVGGPQGPQGDLVDPAPEPVHPRDGVQQMAWQADVDRLEAELRETKLENLKLRNIIGWGPYVVVKLPQGALSEPAAMARVQITVGHGQGVTPELVGPVLKMGQAAVEMTKADRDEGTEHRRAPLPGGRKLIGPPHAHLDAPCTDACYEPAEKPSEARGPWTPGFSRRTS